MTQRRRDGERGSVIVVYAALSGLAILGSAATAMALHEHQVAQRAAHQAQAFYVAESGLDNALVALRANPSWSGVHYAPLYDAAGTEIGGYDVAVTDLGGGQREVAVTGHYPGRDATAPWYVNQGVQATVRVGSSLFDGAIFAQQSIQMSGNAATDSYHSGQILQPMALSLRGHGDIGTNATRAGFVMLAGNVQIHGNAQVGAGTRNPSSVVTASGHSAITGTTTAMTTARVLDPVTIPSGLTNLGTLQVSGCQTVTLPGGTYRYDRVQVSGPGQLAFTGPATLYVSNTFSVTGNGVSTSGNLPANLTIYLSGRTASIAGNGSFYGAIYAPRAAVSVSASTRGTVHGALIGDSVHVSGNATILYDEALGGVEGGSAVTVDLWQRT